MIFDLNKDFFRLKEILNFCPQIIIASRLSFHKSYKKKHFYKDFDFLNEK